MGTQLYDQLQPLYDYNAQKLAAEQQAATEKEQTRASNLAAAKLPAQQFMKSMPAQTNAQYERMMADFARPFQNIQPVAPAQPTGLAQLLSSFNRGAYAQAATSPYAAPVAASPYGQTVSVPYGQMAPAPVYGLSASPFSAVTFGAPAPASAEASK